MNGKNREALQAFAQKMQNEGAAGFAAGLTPWDNWDDFEERVGSRVWQDKAGHVTVPEDSARSSSNRILTTMAILAVATLLIGIGGVFLTKHPAQLLATGPTTTSKLQLPSQEDTAFTSIAAEPTPGATAGSRTRTAIAAIPSEDRARLSTQATPDQMPVAVVANNPASAAEQAVTPAPDMDNQRVFAVLNQQAAPAAGVTEQPSVMTTPSKPEEPRDAIPAQPLQLFNTGELDVHTELQQHPTPGVNQHDETGNGGDWSINIASYLSNATAGKMRQQFLDKDVATDMVTAIVKGKTYYRLRVTGFESRQAAAAQSIIIKKKLNLDDAWITKK